MAHNLCTHPNTQKVSFVYHDDPTQPRPWHGLGIASPALMLPDEALVLASADFRVEARPLFAAGASESGLLEVPNAFATVRTDTTPETVLGVVGSRYVVVQFSEALDLFRNLFPGVPCVDTLGVFGLGERMFASVALPQFTIETAPGDRLERFLILSTAHDGSGAILIFNGSRRTVCANTYNANLRGARFRIAVRHTKNVSEGIKLAGETLKQASVYFERQAEALCAMQARPADRARVREVLVQLFPDKVSETGELTTTESTRAARERIERLFDGGAVGSELAGHTDKGLWDAVTEWVDREQRTRGEGGPRWLRSIFSPVAQDARDRAFALLSTSGRS